MFFTKIEPLRLSEKCLSSNILAILLDSDSGRKTLPIILLHNDLWLSCDNVHAGTQAWTRCPIIGCRHRPVYLIQIFSQNFLCKIVATASFSV